MILSAAPNQQPPHAIDPTPSVALPLVDTIGRDTDVERLWSILASSSLRINEMRRSGKSTVLRLVAARAPANWHCAFAQVQGVRSADEFVALILDELMRHAAISRRLKGSMRQFAKSIKSINVMNVGFELADDFKERPWAVMRQVMTSVNAELERTGKWLVIILDEFPDAIRAIADRDPESAQQVLTLFRSARDNPGGVRIRWILTGSIGFHHVLRDLPGHGEAMTDIIVAPLPPLTAYWTRHLATCYLMGIGQVDPSEQGVDLVSRRSDGIPFVLAMMINELRWNQAALPETKEEADALLLLAANNPMWDDAWTPLLVKVDDYYDELAELAYAVLDIVARTPCTLPALTSALEQRGIQASEQSVSGTLRRLCDDHFLARKVTSGVGQTRYSWKFDSLRLIWQVRRGGEISS